ncbi:MAG: acyltransferase [Gemmatimonadota bacterium]
MKSLRPRFVAASSLLAAGLRTLRHPPPANVAALDALRSAAILLVVFHHWAIKEYALAGGAPSAAQNNPVLYYGWTGVDLFFVLSGYLIGRQLWRELHETGGIRVGRFLLRRGLRIWPIYFVILAYYAVFSANVHPGWPDWTFMSNYAYGQFTRGWSLSTEEQFYIAVPLLLVLVRRRFSLLGHLWLLLGIEAMVLGNRYLLIQRFITEGVALSSPPRQLTDPFHVHMEGLLLGLIIALVAVAKPRLVQPDVSPRGVSWPGIAVMVTAVATGFALRWLNGDLFPYLALALIFGGITYWALRDRSWLSAVLRLPVWYPISRLSYSMYLNHWWVWPRSSEAIVRGVQGITANPTVVFMVSMLIGTMLSVAIAVVMFVCVEYPFLLLRDKVIFPKSAAKRLPPMPYVQPERAVHTGTAEQLRHG